MRLWGLLIVAVAFLATPAWAIAPADLARIKGGETIVQDVPVSEGGSVRAVFFVNAPLTTAREVLWDQERFVEFVPDVKAVKVLERHGNRQVISITGVTGLNDGSIPPEVTVQAGDITFSAKVRIDTPGEADYYRHGGIMQYVLRSLID